MVATARGRDNHVPALHHLWRLKARGESHISTVPGCGWKVMGIRSLLGIAAPSYAFRHVAMRNLTDRNRRRPVAQ
jgi:hypothetical protein